MLCTVVLVGCTQKPKEIPLEARPPEQIFKMAEAKLTTTKGAEEAAKLFGEVERLYPYSEWAKRSIVMSAYAFHKAKKYEKARAAAQRYLDFYPADQDAAYAQYLIALTYYDQIDKVGRDQGNTYRALQALRVVIERYPDSDYARSAKLKFDLAIDHLAAKEMEVGRYYLKRGHYLAAINRFRVVVEDYQTTTQTPEALYRLVEAYLSLGLEKEAQTAAAILGYNFKGTSWYKDAYDLLKGRGLEPKGLLKGKGWLAEVWRQVVKGEWL
ncbi:MAG: outer membrane protein assembly factor BamD [Paracoccaceae bacterium]|nr:outer membrane protein assembly factor BamD [Paracoccaceae bacterium]